MEDTSSLEANSYSQSARLCPDSPVVSIPRPACREGQEAGAMVVRSRAGVPLGILAAAAVLFGIATTLGAIVAFQLRFSLNSSEYPGEFGLRSLPWLTAAVVAPGASLVLILLVVRSFGRQDPGQGQLVGWAMVAGFVSIGVSLLGLGWVFGVQFSLPNNIPSWASAQSSWPPSWYHTTDTAYLLYMACLVGEIVGLLLLYVGNWSQRRRVTQGDEGNSGGVVSTRKGMLPNGRN